MTIIKNNKINPYGVLGTRKVSFPAHHFHYIVLDQDKKIKEIDEWIKNRLKGRYYIESHILLDHSNTIRYQVKIGFEDAKELNFFILAHPGLKNR